MQQLAFVKCSKKKKSCVYLVRKRDEEIYLFRNVETRWVLRILLTGKYHHILFQCEDALISCTWCAVVFL